MESPEDSPAQAGESQTEEVAEAAEASSFVLDHLLAALGDAMPAGQREKLAPYGARAAHAGTDPAAERRRALRCAEWADEIVAIPAHSHLAKLARRAREVVRELGRTASSEIADAQLLVYWRDHAAVSPEVAAEATWVAEAIHVAKAVADQVGWEEVPWESLIEDLLAVTAP